MMRCVAAFGAAILAVEAMGGEAMFSGDFWTDSGFYGDGRWTQEECRATPEKAPHGFRIPYRVNVGEAGWYETRFIGGHMAGGISADWLVDGRLVALATPMASTKERDVVIGPYLWLDAGEREVRIELLGRRSFPTRMFGKFELHKTKRALCVDKAGHDVVRLGREKMKLRLSGFGGQAVEVKIAPQAKDPAWQTVATAALPAGGKAETTVEIEFPAEGMYYVKGWRDGVELPQNEFPRLEAAAVDVSAAADAAKPGEFSCETVAEIDCVARPPDFEANGKSRVTVRNGLTYRETHDNTKETAEPYDGTQSPNLSGFSYRVCVPKAQTPYLLEYEIADDDRRVMTFRHDWLAADGSVMKGNQGYQSKGTETGGFFPLTGKMVRQSQIMWPLSTNGIISVMNLRPGARAAVAKIRLSRFRDDVVPNMSASAKGGRTFAYWEEEGENYGIMIGAGGSSALNGNLTYIDKAKRWLEMVRFYGGNAVSGMGIAYQGASWRTRALRTSLEWPPFSHLRLLALLAERYGMTFTPEWFNSGHPYWTTVRTYPFVGERTEDSQSLSASGVYPDGNVVNQSVNPLSPHVQADVLAGMREIVDEIGDSPAFGGVSFRVDPWQYSGEFCFKSLLWGYNDCIVRDFMRETGINVPDGDASARYLFLTQGDKAVRERWIRWRCDRIAAYHAKILDVLRGGTAGGDVKFMFSGRFDQDSQYAKPAAVAERALGCGIDLVQMPKGMAFLPVARYGDDGNSPIQSREVYGEFFLLENAGLGRGFAAYMNYRELGNDWPAAALGVPYKPGKATYHCSALLGAGRAVLEKYAAVLAESDVAYLRDGGNSDCLGDPRVVGPWLAAYGRIPAVPFERVPGVNDPVAAWHREVDGTYWHYLVNREGFATTATLTYSDGTKKTVPIEPWGLVVEGERGSRRIVGVTSEYPAEWMSEVRKTLAAAEGVVKGAEAKAALGRAWDAAIAGRWWRTRMELSSAPVMADFADAGNIPPLLDRSPFPNRMDSGVRHGHWTLCTPQLNLAEIGGKTVPSESVNAAWAGDRVVWSEEGDITLRLNVKAAGRYDLHVGHVAAARGYATVDVDGKRNGGILTFAEGRKPGMDILRGVDLPAGSVSVRIAGTSPLGVYAARCLPSLKPIPGDRWLLTGSIDSPCRDEGFRFSTKSISASFDNLARIYAEKRDELTWHPQVKGIEDMLSDRGVNVSLRTSGMRARDSWIARTEVRSGAARRVQIVCAIDWWCKVLVNGKEIKTDCTDASGAGFTTWYPYYTGLADLREGANEIAILGQSGSFGAAFAAWISDDDAVTMVCPAMDAECGKRR